MLHDKYLLWHWLEQDQNLDINDVFRFSIFNQLILLMLLEFEADMKMHCSKNGRAEAVWKKKIDKK